MWSSCIYDEVILESSWDFQNYRYVRLIYYFVWILLLKRRYPFRLNFNITCRWRKKSVIKSKVLASFFFLFYIVYTFNRFNDLKWRYGPKWWTQTCGGYFLYFCLLYKSLFYTMPVVALVQLCASLSAVLGGVVQGGCGFLIALSLYEPSRFMNEVFFTGSRKCDVGPLQLATFG